MVGEGTIYASYLLRLWKTEEEGEPHWRASLVSVQTGERRSFANLELMVAFLQEKINSSHSPEICATARQEK